MTTVVLWPKTSSFVVKTQRTSYRIDSKPILQPAPEKKGNSAQCYAQPCSFCRPHTLTSGLPRQYLINCLLNTWRQSQRGNYRGHNHVCMQPSLTDHTSFTAEKRPCCKARGWSATHTSNMTQQMSQSLRLIKPGICCWFFIRVPDLELCQGLEWERIIPYS